MVLVIITQLLCLSMSYHSNNKHKLLPVYVLSFVDKKILLKKLLIVYHETFVGTVNSNIKK